MLNFYFFLVGLMGSEAIAMLFFQNNIVIEKIFMVTVLIWGSISAVAILRS